MNCNVTYKLAESCEKMRFSCSSSDIHNKLENNWNWGCEDGDRMEIDFYNEGDYYSSGGRWDRKR